ncbi:MAG: hypothetical protein CL790_03180 [Chloroflexi bacterium]|nr:hypothetical protein [Chloroflexota bacterium]
MPDTGRKTHPPGSYSTVERRALLPLRQFGSGLCHPLVKLLATLGVPATALSLSQIPLGFLAAILVVRAPQAACLLFFLAIFLDFLDGEVARATGTDSEFGALVDQVSDHVREITLVGGLVAWGHLRGEIGVAYALAYPLSNFLLYLADRGKTPVTFSVKTWMLFYPGLIAFCWSSINVLDHLVSLTAGLLGLAGAQALWKLRRAAST